MRQLESLAERLPDTVKDLRINLGNVLGSEALSRDQTWGVIVAAALFVRQPAVRAAALADAAAETTPAVIEDAQAAAALMGMNTIFYRFRHMIGKEEYAKRPARLRMQRMLTPATSKRDFELFALACAALAGCEACLKAHEASVLKEGLGEDAVQDVIRLAAVIHGLAIAVDFCE